jgi:hypothetical protein
MSRIAKSSVATKLSWQHESLTSKEFGSCELITAGASESLLKHRGLLAQRGREN